MNAQIILRDGTLIPISEWQRRNNLPSTHASTNFTVEELGLTKPDAVMSELLLRMIQGVRNLRGRPLKINSGFRTVNEARGLHAKYASMMASGAMNASSNPASLNSPHSHGMAADLDETTPNAVRQLESDIRTIASTMGIKIRIGIRQYLGAGMTFVHMDVCPEYFAPGKPFYMQPHPSAWERPITW